MKIKELINYGKNFLSKNNIDDSAIISKMLAEYILGLDRNKIIISEDKEVEENEKERYYLGLIEIVQGMPIQYITNKQEFMGLNFYVDENVLIPQPDTEILVEEVINICKERKENIKILDICTGSGAIGISVAKYIENVKVILSDISTNALKVAKKNTKVNKVEDKIEIIESDMFENISNKFDIIVSNPPYIVTEVIKTLDKEVQNEPNLALDGGEDGLDFYRILVKNAKEFLKPNGYLCMEIGYNQKEAVENLLEENNYKNIYSKKDLSGNDRIVVANKEE